MDTSIVQRTLCRISPLYACILTKQIMQIEHILNRIQPMDYASGILTEAPGKDAAERESRCLKDVLPLEMGVLIVVIRTMVPKYHFVGIQKHWSFRL